jgi:hypothetical protein
MPGTLGAAQYKLPVNALVDAIRSAEAASDWSNLRAAHDKALAALRSRREEFDALYERAIAPDTNWDEIAEVASMIGMWRHAAAKKLYPQLDALQRKLGAPHGHISRDARQALQQSIKVAEAWLTLYRDLQNKLLKLAAKQRPAHAVLRAHPIEGDIDHDTLTREVIARFPKILAALAE